MRRAHLGEHRPLACRFRRPAGNTGRRIWFNCRGPGRRLLYPRESHTSAVFGGPPKTTGRRPVLPAAPSAFFR
jgi:hypothetical protein